MGARVILSSVRIRLLYYGVLKDIFGLEQEMLALSDGAKVEDAICLLRGRTSNNLGRVWETMAVAVNDKFARTTDVLHDGDELALLPPVSGGCVREIT